MRIYSARQDVARLLMSCLDILACVLIIAKYTPVGMLHREATNTSRRTEDRRVLWVAQICTYADDVMVWVVAEDRREERKDANSNTLSQPSHHNRPITMRPISMGCFYFQES